MKIPKKLKIGGLWFQVVESADVANQGNAFGSMHCRQQKIFIEPSETQQKKEDTLIHEILHAIWWSVGLCERFKDNPKIEEEIVASLGNSLYQVLKDNRLLK